MDFGQTKEIMKLKDGYRVNEMKRQTGFSEHKFNLQKTLLMLRDKIAGNRHAERIGLMKVKVI